MAKQFLATVVAVESSVKFTDRRPRVTLKFDGCDAMYGEIRFPVTDDEAEELTVDSKAVVVASVVECEPQIN